MKHAFWGKFLLLSRKELGCLLSLAYSGSSQLRSGFSSLPQQSDGKPRAVSDPAQIASYNSLMVRVWSNNVAVGTIPSILSIPFYQESVRAIAQLSVTCPWGALFGMTLLPITTLHAPRSGIVDLAPVYRRSTCDPSGSCRYDVATFCRYPRISVEF